MLRICYNVESVDRNTFLLDDYYKHQCVDNNNNASDNFFILPKGEIFISISECSWLIVLVELKFMTDTDF
jgi:hypothetical protein